MDTVLEIFKNSGGWMDGHTEFKNGYHGNGWIEKGFIIRKPRLLDAITKFQAEQVRKEFPDVELIVGPVTCGVIVASYVSRHLDQEYMITLGKGDEVEFHRMFTPRIGTKIVLVEDLLFTGVDVISNLKYLKQQQMEVMGVSVWINRRENLLEGTRVISLIEPPFQTFLSTKCPLCECGEELIHRNIRE